MVLKTQQKKNSDRSTENAASGTTFDSVCMCLWVKAADYLVTPTFHTITKNRRMCDVILPFSGKAPGGTDCEMLEEQH